MSNQINRSSSTAPRARPVKILDPILANQIAAGEVVERPASAIKELLENALDAGSTELTIEIREGGRALMRVSDNGHGMTKDDALLALERHATSKISGVNDLNEINTLGFRGEALPSIASVSRFQLLTRIEGSQSATQVRIEGGKNLQISEGAGRIGTEVRVEDLFFNVPARRKFLKSAQTESGIIHEGVQRQALAYPHVAFKFIKDDHISLEMPSHPSTLDRIRALFGARIADHLCPIAWSGPIRLTGFISHPSFHFSAHRHAYTFINGRFVKDRLFLGAIQRAFGQKLPRGRYPFYLLNLDIHPSLVDVNVHPAKTQVRFVNEESLLDVLTKAFKAAMSEMVFEDRANSWRDKVIDHSALTSETSQKIDENDQSAHSSHSVQPEVNESLAAHRARIQARLRQHLHGEDSEFLNQYTEEGQDHSTNTSNLNELSLAVVENEERVPNTRSKKGQKDQSSTSEDFHLSPSGRHGVQRVTQADLAAWKSESSQDHDQQEKIEALVEDTQKTDRHTSSTPTVPSTDSSSVMASLPSLVDHTQRHRHLLPTLDNLHNTESRKQLRAVGRADEWWVQEAADGIVMVHLPTARVHALTDQPSPCLLTTALQLKLNQSEEKELARYQEQLIELGVTIEPFGGQSYRVTTLPIGLEKDEPQRLNSMLHDLLSSRYDQALSAWSKGLLNLPLTVEGRAFTLKWLDNGGASDPKLPPFTLSMTYAEMMRRCTHLHPF